MKLTCAALLFLCLTACARRETRAVAPSVLPDSVSLQRTPCFGLCPAYSLTLTKSGRVSYSDRAKDTTDTLPLRAYANLAAEFEGIGFSAFPARTQDSPEFCTPYATDMPSAIVIYFVGEKMKVVHDYHGCFGSTAATKAALRDLRRLEDQIDSTARTARWIKQAEVR